MVKEAEYKFLHCSRSSVFFMASPTSDQSTLWCCQSMLWLSSSSPNTIHTTKVSEQHQLLASNDADDTLFPVHLLSYAIVTTTENHARAELLFLLLHSKAPFVATQLNSTQLDVELSRVELRRFGHPLRRTTPIADGRWAARSQSVLSRSVHCL